MKKQEGRRWSWAKLRLRLINVTNVTRVIEETVNEIKWHLGGDNLN